MAQELASASGDEGSSWAGVGERVTVDSVTLGRVTFTRVPEEGQSLVARVWNRSEVNYFTGSQPVINGMFLNRQIVETSNPNVVLVRFMKEFDVMEIVAVPPGKQSAPSTDQASRRRHPVPRGDFGPQWRPTF